MWRTNHANIGSSQDALVSWLPPGPPHARWPSCWTEIFVTSPGRLGSTIHIEHQHSDHQSGGTSSPSPQQDLSPILGLTAWNKSGQQFYPSRTSSLEADSMVGGSNVDDLHLAAISHDQLDQLLRPKALQDTPSGPKQSSRDSPRQLQLRIISHLSVGSSPSAATM